MSRDAAYLAEIRPGWRRNWLQCIAEFADYDLQRRSWLGGPDYDSPYWSFDEWMCRYFDDYSMSSGYSWALEDGLLSHEEASVVAQFHAAADAYTPPAGVSSYHSAILSDPAWLSVVQLADAARIQLLTILSDPAERALLERNAG